MMEVGNRYGLFKF